MTPNNHRLLIQVIDDISSRNQLATRDDILAYVSNNGLMWQRDWQALSTSLIVLGLCAFEEMKMNGGNHVQS